MTIIENVEKFFKIGEPIPIDEMWKRDENRRRFWWLSFDCFGPDYSKGKDVDNVNVIRQHERETEDDYKRRVENATPYCAAGPIIRQYTNFVFRKKPNLNETTEEFKKFNADVDGMGTDAITYWQELLGDAQVARDSFNLIDTNNTTGVNTMTRVQADDAGLRVFWRKIKASQVLFQRDFMGKMVEAAVLFQKESGEWVIWIANDISKVEIELELIQQETVKLTPKPLLMNFRIKRIGPVGPHGFIALPLVRLRPKFGTVSQIAPLAELQKKMARLLSQLDEEMLDSTFSQAVVTGQAGPNTTGDTETNSTEINFGNKRIMFMGNEKAKYTTIGADVKQAESLRKTIDDLLTQMFKTAGIQPDVSQDTNQVESGLAKQFKFNDLSANLAALSKAVQEAHRQSEIITLSAMDVKEESESPVMYDSDFNLPNFEAELDETIRTTASGLPPTIVKIVAKRFAERNLSLSDDEKETLQAELDRGMRFGQPSLIQGSTDGS